MSEVMTIEEKIKKIIVSKVRDEEKARSLEYGTPLLTLGIDSILALSILVEVEEEFDIEIDDADLNMDRLRSIESFSALVKLYLDRK
ncbi:acyl carrier protein [Ruminiclostridium cellobioparum]|jgi:acyl carrier protein|uniref:acyl carrier protein n=1 Tax=Ruminiclostridium cellobioparum TaxID=29355 RepID=UPI000555BA85|nr:acyl carrier protein [Ruminiclostridium cellobioparum]